MATAGGSETAADTALSAMFEEHYAPMLRLAYLLLGDQGAAEEVVQEGFLRMHASGRRVRDPGRAVSYLRSIVLNGARGRLRHLAVAHRHDRADEVVTRSWPELDVERRDSRRQVVAALRTLPDRQRECLVLRYYLNLPESEIAATLGISNGSVKTHVHRGLAALEAKLEALR